MTSVNWVVRITLTEKRTLEQRLEAGEAVSLKDIQRKTRPGSGRSQCKGPEMCWGNSTEASVGKRN